MEIPQSPEIVGDTPVPMQAPEGMDTLVFRTYPGYDSLMEGDAVNTVAVDFVTFTFIDVDTIENAMNAVVSASPVVAIAVTAPIVSVPATAVAL